MQTHTFTLTATDGLELALYRWSPKEEPKAIVQFVHGMAEHAMRYERAARVLTEAGYVVYAADQRGHGKSIRSQDDLGFYAEKNGWAQAVGDIGLIGDHLRKEHPGLKLALVAHSMGSFMAQQRIIDAGSTLDAVALSGSNGKTNPALLAAGRMAARVSRKLQGPRGRSKLLDSLSFGSYNKQVSSPRTKFDWLSRDEAEVDKYIADPLCGFLCTNQLWVDLLGGIAEISKPENVARVPKDLPLYIFAGTDDPVGEYSKGLDRLVEAYKNAGIQKLERRYYAGGRHEMFNETNRDEVTQDLISWLDRVLFA